MEPSREHILLMFSFRQFCLLLVSCASCQAMMRFWVGEFDMEVEDIL